jgi:hypothetical protein
VRREEVISRFVCGRWSDPVGYKEKGPMITDDEGDLCIHEMIPDYCTFCNGKDRRTTHVQPYVISFGTDDQGNSYWKDLAVPLPDGTEWMMVLETYTEGRDTPHNPSEPVWYWWEHVEWTAYGPEGRQLRITRDLSEGSLWRYGNFTDRVLTKLFVRVENMRKLAQKSPERRKKQPPLSYSVPR